MGFGTTLSTSLQVAGLHVHRHPRIVATLGQALRLVPTGEFRNEAMGRLPVEFSGLTSTSTGRQFVTELRRVLTWREKKLRERKAVCEVNRHTIYGLCQLVHRLRDAHQDERRKSFEQIIPIFQKLKADVADPKIDDIAGRLLEALS